MIAMAAIVHSSPKVLIDAIPSGIFCGMDKLLAYLNGLSPDAQADFAGRCRTSVGYLRKACSVKQKLSDGLCLRIGVESMGAVQPEDLRPDVDWPYFRAALCHITPAVADPIAEALPPEAVVVAVLVTPPQPLDAGKPVQPRRVVRRLHPESPEDHSDTDRRAEEGPTHLGRRFDNGGADKAQGV